MKKWMENIDLSGFRAQIGSFVNQLVDPASLVIPNDSVFVTYRNVEQLRLMSADSLRQMLRQMDESRQFIEKAPKDVTEIALVVGSSDTEKPYEKVLKDVLRFLVEQGLNRAQIRMTCNVLNLGVIQALNAARNNELLAKGIINDIKMMLGMDKAHLVDVYMNALNASDKSSDVKMLPQYLEELITQQAVELETQRKKLRDDKGDDLKPEEVICPLTRQVIDVDRSVATQANASQFMMLVVSLAQLAKIKSNDLDDFISSQDKDYVNTGFDVLHHYAQNPKSSVFTVEQQGLLEQLGMSTVLQQWQAQKITVEAEDTENVNETPQHVQGQAFRFFGVQQEKVDKMGQFTSYTP